jgi:hypothetical protein
MRTRLRATLHIAAHSGGTRPDPTRHGVSGDAPNDWGLGARGWGLFSRKRRTGERRTQNVDRDRHPRDIPLQWRRNYGLSFASPSVCRLLMATRTASKRCWRRAAQRRSHSRHGTQRRRSANYSPDHMLTFPRLFLPTLKWRHAMKGRVQRFAPGRVRRFVMTCGVVSLIAVGWPNREPTQASAVESPAVPPPPAPVENRPPLPLLDVGKTAAVLFDAARLANWSDAEAAFQDMTESATNLPASNWKPDLAKQLQSRLEEVGDALSTRQRLQTMGAANGITQLVADLSEEYQTELPYALVMLGYYGRALELGIAAGDPARLQQAVADLQQTWNRFEPIVLQRGAVDDARRFTDIVAQLDGAKTPADFVEPTRAELEAVVRLKDMF